MSSIVYTKKSLLLERNGNDSAPTTLTADVCTQSMHICKGAVRHNTKAWLSPSFLLMTDLLTYHHQQVLLEGPCRSEPLTQRASLFLEHSEWNYGSKSCSVDSAQASQTWNQTLIQSTWILTGLVMELWLNTAASKTKEDLPWWAQWRWWEDPMDGVDSQSVSPAAPLWSALVQFPEKVHARFSSLPIFHMLYIAKVRQNN